MITIDDFAKVEIIVGLVMEAIDVPGSEKLIRMTVDFGEEQRVIFTGVRKWYSVNDLLGKKFLFVTNLEPRKMMGEESQGMILAVDGSDGRPVFVIPAEEVNVGSKLR